MNTTSPEETLLATFPSLEAATKAINRYFYSETISLQPDREKQWYLTDSTGFVRPRHVVKQKGNRFRFILVRP